MFGISNYAMFIGASILLNITPGPDTMYILGRSISQGKKVGVVSVLGIITGAGIHTILAALGLSVILAKSALAFNIVKYVGAIYLVYLGIIALRTKSDESLVKHNSQDATRKVYIQGVLTNLFNPKVALFFLALLPQFVSGNNTYGTLPFLFLGLTFITTGTIWCMFLAVCASTVTRKLRNNSRVSVVLNKITGTLFIGLGLNLVRAKAAN